MRGIPTFDHKKCTRCGRCAEICPKRIIRENNNRMEIAGEGCLLCSHCYAVCRFGAIGFDSADLRPLAFASFRYAETVIPAGKFRPADLVNLSRSRRSVRRYMEKAVPEPMLRDLVEFAVTAPSGSNRQLWEFTIVNGREKVFAIARGIQKFFEKLNRIAGNPILRYASVLFKGATLLRYYRNHYASV